MLKYLALFIAIAMCGEVFGGNRIFIEEIDVSELPEVSARVYSFTDSFTPVNLVSQDYLLNDNGDIVEVTLSNPAPMQAQACDLIYLVDLASFTADELDSVKVLIKTLNEQLISGSRSALMSFDQKVYLNANFTEDLNSGLDQLSPEDVSVLDSAFISEKLNPFTLINTGANNKILVISSHLKGPKEIENIKQLIDNYSTDIIVANVNDVVNLELRDLAFYSGGDYVLLDEDISNYYSRLYSAIYSFESSTISWISNRDCISDHSVTFSVKGESEFYTSSYFLPDSIKPALVSDPEDKKFTNVIPGEIDSVDFFIKAENSDVVISNIELSNDYNGVFKLLGVLDEDIDQPVRVQQGDEYPLRLFFEPTDSSIVFTRILITSNVCSGNEIKVIGGFPNTPPKNNTIEVVYPNCGESIAVGEEIDVEWTGLLPRDVIQLEYTVDNGANWDTLAKNVLNLKYRWTVPDRPSDECLVRAIQLWPNNIGRTIDLNHGEDVDVNMAKFNKDGSLIVSGSSDGMVRVWNSNTAELIATLAGHTDEIVSVDFSPNEDYIVSASRDGSAILWNGNQESDRFGELIRRYEDHTRALFSAKFNPYSNRFITASADGDFRIYSVDNDQAIIEGNTNTSQTRYAVYSDDGSYYAVANNRGIVWLFDARTNDTIKTIDTGLELTTGPCSYIDFSPDSKKLATVNDNLKYVSVWNIDEDEPEYNFVHDPFYRDDNSKLYIPTHCSFFYSSKDTFLLSSANNNTIQWDLQTGDSVNTFIEHESRVSSAYYNFDGVRVLTSSWDGLVKIWNLQERDLQMDTSDCVFSIIIPEIQANDIAFGETLISQSKYLNIEDFITNSTNAFFEIKEMTLRGRDRSEFILMNDHSGRIINGNEQLPLGILFDPISLGQKQAFIDIIIPNDTVTIEITASAYENDLRFSQRLIEFNDTETDDLEFFNSPSFITNISSEEITIDSVQVYYPDRDVFALTVNDYPVDLGIGQSSRIDLQFTPDTIDFYNASLKVFHSGKNSSSKALILGSGVKPRVDTVTLEIKNVNGLMGEVVSTGIYIKNVSQLGVTDEITSFSTKISFNASMLEPLFPFESSELDGITRTLDLTIPIVNREEYLLNEETLIYQLDFKCLLGNDISSKIDLHDTYPDQEAKILITEIDAIYNFDSYCEEGGLRLFEDKGRFELMQNRPNPASASTIIEFEIIEKGRSKLYVLNSTGEEVATLVNDQREPGRYQIELDLNDFPSGVYYYILETPTRTSFKKLLVSEN